MTKNDRVCYHWCLDTFKGYIEMNTQPHERSEVEALRLADYIQSRTRPIDSGTALMAAAELRRLHALNAQLTQVSKELLREMRYIASFSNGQVSRVARIAISRAESTLKTE